MDIDLIYKKLKDKLLKTDCIEIINTLDDLIKSGATSSEILFSTGKYLYDLKIEKPIVYEIIKDEICAYLDYCKQNEIFIK
jgi:hypothetical protein